MTEPFVVPALSWAGQTSFHALSWGGPPSGLGPSVDASAILSAPSGPIDVGSVDHRCALPPPYREIPAEWAGRLLPAELDGELNAVEEAFLAQPTDAHITTFLAVLERHGLHIQALRDRLASNCLEIMTGGRTFAAFAPETFRDASDAGLRELFRGLDASFARSRADSGAFDNSLYQPVERILSERLFRMIRETSGDPVQALMNESFAHYALGDVEAADLTLRRALDELDADPAPLGPEGLVRRITVLHRLASLTDHYHADKPAWLARASDDVTLLAETHPDIASLLRSENLQLRLSAEGAEIRRETAAGLIDEDEVTAVYAGRVGALYRDWSQDAERSLDRIEDPVERDFLRRHLAGAAAGLIEHEYGVALAFHLQDEEDEAAAHAGAAETEFASLDRLQPLLGREMYAEVRARALLARAYYQFRTGRMEAKDGRTGAVDDIETLLRDYPQSSAAAVARAPGNWPHQYGIVDDEGRPSADLHEPDFLAGLLTAASLLTENESRALAGCGVGAVLGAGASLVFGEKISGAAVISSCLLGVAGERALYVFENLDRVGEAYRTGVSNVTLGDALASLGRFGLTLLSLYGGLRLGALLQRGTAAAGTALGEGASAYLTRIGFAPGPWTRGVASFLLRETGHAANAVGINAAAVAGQRVLHPDAGLEFTGDTLLDTWLFARFLPPIVRANPVARLLPGVPVPPTALQPLNFTAGLTAVEIGREFLHGGDFQNFGDQLARDLFHVLPFWRHLSRPPSEGANPPPAPPGGGRTDYAALRPGQVAEVPIADIVPTQGKVFSAQVEAYRTGRLRGDLPEIRVLDGVPYVVDGHHRLYAAYQRGDKTVEVRNYDPATDPYSRLKPTLPERATRWRRIAITPSTRIYGSRTVDPRTK